MSNEIVDFRKLARAAARARRSTCHHDYQKRRNGTERCTSCGDSFPCKADCWHVDCWVRRLNLGLVQHYPTVWAWQGLKIGDGLVYDTTEDDPIDWTLPTSDTTLEDVS